MTRSNADVIIVGAGPAGAVTALLLARAGVDVLVVDRATFPRPKPCGDCLSIGATALLSRLGVLERVLAAPHARLRGWRIVAPGGASFEASFTDGDALMQCALAVERAVFDAILLDAALAAGARFEQHTITDLVRDGDGTVTGVRSRVGVRAARVTIGADGLRSIVARRLGACAAPGSLRKLSLTFHVEIDDVGRAGEMHVGDGICAGIAPVAANGRCNVTLVADAGRFGRAAAARTHGFARACLDALPELRNRASDDALIAARPLASGPFDRPVNRCAFDGAVLVGDAAGYYDPFTGQGVFQAVASAELLAPCVAEALRRSDTRARSFERYVQARRSLLRGPRLVQRGIEAVLSRPALANRAVARIRRAPLFAHAILAVTGDVEPARALLSPRPLASLIVPAIPEIVA